MLFVYYIEAISLAIQTVGKSLDFKVTQNSLLNNFYQIFFTTIKCCCLKKKNV